MTTQQRVILLSTQRTGSTWLVNMLAKHPDIEMFGEVFLDRPFDTSSINVQRHLSPDSIYNYRREHAGSRAAQNRGFLKDVGFKNFFKQDTKCVGFKLMYGQLLANPDLFLMLRSARVIHLVRDNLLDTFLSDTHKDVTHQPHAFVDAEQTAAGQCVPLRIDTSAMLKRLKKMAFKRRMIRISLKMFASRFHELRYEDLVAEPADEYAHICRFLDVEDIALPMSTTRKIIRSSHRELIVNFDEVRQKLAGTPYHQYLKTSDAAA
jgi:LPS sulfotransferase NodH